MHKLVPAIIKVGFNQFFSLGFDRLFNNIDIASATNVFRQRWKVVQVFDQISEFIFDWFARRDSEK